MSKLEKLFRTRKQLWTRTTTEPENVELWKSILQIEIEVSNITLNLFAETAKKHVPEQYESIAKELGEILNKARNEVEND